MERIRRKEYGQKTNNLERIADSGRRRAEGVGNELSLPNTDQEKVKEKGRFTEDEALKLEMAWVTQLGKMIQGEDVFFERREKHMSTDV